MNALKIGCVLLTCLALHTYAHAQQGSEYRLQLLDQASYRLSQADAATLGVAPDGVTRSEALRDLPFASHVERAASLGGIDPELLHAVVQTESAYRPRALSPKGAQGLAQLMPDTARHYGVKDAFQPADNLRAGARLLRELLDRFGDLELALAAYNAGAGAVIRHGGVPPYSETREYVPRVAERYRSLKRKSQSAARPVPDSPYKLRRSWDEAL